MVLKHKSSKRLGEEKGKFYICSDDNYKSNCSD